MGSRQENTTRMDCLFFNIKHDTKGKGQRHLQPIKNIQFKKNTTALNTITSNLLQNKFAVRHKGFHGIFSNVNVPEIH